MRKRYQKEIGEFRLMLEEYGLGHYHRTIVTEGESNYMYLASIAFFKEGFEIYDKMVETGILDNFIENAPYPIFIFMRNDHPEIDIYGMVTSDEYANAYDKVQEAWKETIRPTVH